MERLVHKFTLSTFALVTAVVRKMLKTRVTLGNISRVLLNLTKRLIFAMFKDSSSFLMFKQLQSYFLFSSPITAASCLNFCSLALSVWLASWYVFLTVKSLFRGRLRIALVFTFLTTFGSLYIILMFFVYYINLLHYSCLHLSQKWLLMRFILSVVLERTVRFLTTVDVVLE